MTALHYAAYQQDLRGVQECIEAGFDIHQKDSAGWTPLIWCIDMAATGEIGTAESIIDYLVARGAKLDYQDEDYRSIVEFAESRDHLVAEYIRKLLTS